MIVFLTMDNKKDIKNIMKEYEDDIFISISNEHSMKSLEEGKQLIPPPFITMEYIDRGNKDKFQEDYWHYLNDPRVKYMLLLQLLKSADHHLFYVSSTMEKEMRYPKYLKEFLTDTIGIDEKYVTSYKKFSGGKKYVKGNDLDKIIAMVSKEKGKATEAYRVYGSEFQ